MPPPRIVVTREPPGRALAMLSDHGAVWLFPHDRAMEPDELLEQLPGAAGLYCMITDTIDGSVLDHAPSLQAISSMAVGVDNIDLDACTARGIPVGHTPDVLTETVADTAIGLLIVAARRFSEGIDYVRAGEWLDWQPDLLLGRDVHSSTLGIIGYGRVGQAIARRAEAFAMRILYWNRSEVSNPVGERVSLEVLLDESDHVVVAVALNEETRGLIGADELGAMKRSATLVNISRGPTVDTDALVAALDRGDIAAAALDVTDPEPLPADHPLLGLGNCTVIPHLGSSSLQTREAMAELAAANLIAGLAGERMIAAANPAVYT